MMKVTVLFSLVLLIIINATLSQENDPCSTDASPNIVHMKPGKTNSYFYLVCEKAVVVYNRRFNSAVTFDRNSRTLGVFNTTTGSGGILNLKTKMGYVLKDDLQTFDMSQIDEGNYESISAIHEYGARLIPYVTGVNETNPNLVNYGDIWKNRVMSFPASDGFRRWFTAIQNLFKPLVQIVREIYPEGDFKVDGGPHALTLARFNNEAPDPTKPYLSGVASILIFDKKGMIQSTVKIDSSRLLDKEKVMTAIQRYEDVKGIIRKLDEHYGSIANYLDVYAKST